MRANLRKAYNSKPNVSLEGSHPCIPDYLAIVPLKMSPTLQIRDRHWSRSLVGVMLCSQWNGASRRGLRSQPQATRRED